MEGTRPTGPLGRLRLHGVVYVSGFGGDIDAASVEESRRREGPSRPPGGSVVKKSTITTDRCGNVQLQVVDTASSESISGSREEISKSAPRVGRESFEVEATAPQICLEPHPGGLEATFMKSGTDATVEEAPHHRRCSRAKGSRDLDDVQKGRGGAERCLSSGQSATKAARISRECVDGQTTTSGTDAKAECAADHQKRSTPKYRQDPDEVESGLRGTEICLSSVQLAESARVGRDGCEGKATTSGTGAKAECAPHHQKRSTAKYCRDLDEVDRNLKRRGADSELSSGQRATESLWNDVRQNSGSSKFTSKNDVEEDFESGNDTNVDSASHHYERCMPKDRRDPVEFHAGHRGTDSNVSSGQRPKSAWNYVRQDASCSKPASKKTVEENWESSSKKKRSRNKNVNASTQTASVGDNFPRLGDRSARSREDRKVHKDGGNDEVDYRKLADVVMSMAAPILASELRTAMVESKHRGGKTAPDRDHYSSGKMRVLQQEKEYRSPWRQTADIMARPPVVRIMSCESSRAVHEAGSASSLADSCPRCGDRRRLPADVSMGGRTSLERLLAEMCRYCDRDGHQRPGEAASASRLKAKLKEICTGLMDKR